MSVRRLVGAVSYLNTRPLVYSMHQFAGEIEVVFDLPSRLADRLSAGELDVALIPSIEAVGNPDHTIISDACIACRGPVRSVKLLSRVPLDCIETLALDVGSRTSVALAKIILAEQHGCTPGCQPLEMNEDWRTVEADAVVIIGDRAMASMVDDQAETARRFRFEFDLGELWNRWTGLPFVFAVWTARADSDLEQLDCILRTCRDDGVRNLDAICRMEAPHYQLTVDECREYLGRQLHFVLGPREKAGLDLFLELACRHALIAESSKLSFYDCQVS
jgi:chorismate dehydratase